VKLSSEITFHDSRVCELACQWVKPDGGAKLMEYFQQVFPVAQRYGVEAKARLVPEASPAGDFVPHVIAMVEWPRLESFDAFMEDLDYRRLHAMRDAALDRLVVTHARPVASATVLFSGDKMYEVAGLWVRPDGGRERLIDYLTKALPVAHEYGARPLLKLAPSRSAWGDFLPTQVHLTEWPDGRAFERFTADKRAAQLRPLRDSALSKLTTTHCRAQIAGH
jgi:uncharacterized protein (DUF1330 family)